MKTGHAILCTVFLTLWLCLAESINAEMVELAPVKDNTLYESGTGSASNGVGVHFFVGRTNGGQIRRGVIAFDIAGQIPTGSTINSVTLTLRMSRSAVGSRIISLHRLLKDWGEGNSNAGGNEGGGAGASDGDATWLHTFFPSSFWTNPGGDFSTTVSASTSVGGTGSYNWGSTSQLVADVQGWLEQPSSDLGWILIGPEGSRSAKRFDSREIASLASRPVLAVDFTPPPESTVGDVTGDGKVSLEDAIVGLQVLAGEGTPVGVDEEADANGDGTVGFEEVIYVLQRVSSLR